MNLMCFRKRLILCVLIWILPASGNAQSVELRGYAKNLGVSSKSFLDDSPLWFDVSRVRLEGIAEKGNWFATTILDTEFSFGSFYESPEYQLTQAVPRSLYLDFLEWTIASGKRYEFNQRIHRAYVQWYSGKWQVKAGRQRVAWGTGFVWNPTDLLNPINPSAIERDEKQGVDAISATVETGALSRLEAVFAPGWTDKPSSVAARGTFHRGEFDISLMAGTLRGNWVGGADFAGYLGDAGFRGEAAVVDADSSTYLRGVLNGDYNFPGGYYTIIEYHFNGSGTANPDEYDYLSLLDGNTINLARHYVALFATKSVSSLVNAGVYGLVNLNDGSALIGPNLTWSPVENLDAGVGGYFFLGDATSEYGRQHHAFFGSIQLYF